MTRQPDWDIDRLRGEEAEGWVRELRFRMLAGTVEVKRDDRALETGNLYLEYEAWTAQGWKPSGLAQTKANDLVIYCWPFLVAAPAWMWRQIGNRACLGSERGRRAECKVGSHPTRGVLVPLDCVLPWLRDAATSITQEAAA